MQKCLQSFATSLWLMTLLNAASKTYRTMQMLPTAEIIGEISSWCQPPTGSRSHHSSNMKWKKTFDHYTFLLKIVIFVGQIICWDILCMVIGIDHDTVCAGVGSTAIRHSTKCAGRRAAAPACTTRAVPDGSTTHDSADRISGQFLFYHDHNFTKSKGNLRFQCFVPLFVPIGVCVSTHDDGTANDVTIGMWRHNQQATNHERKGKPWFSFPK